MAKNDIDVEEAQELLRVKTKCEKLKKELTGKFNFQRYKVSLTNKNLFVLWV